MRKPELLAPAGDLERLKWAILYGADAVYIGGPGFGLRANASNFTLDEIKEGVEFAHAKGARVHVTVNMVLHNKELKGLEEYLKKLEEIGVDAIIVSDPTVLKIAHEKTNLEIHISTQQSTLNREAVEFWKSQGATRVVLGREASREEIKDIIDHVDIEVETFIHGAMCASYSGRCVLSNFLTARDSNRGGCAQICRWDFDLYNENKKIITEKPFTFCTKDLSMLSYLPDMIDLGITSFKIEGRMRSLYYIATVVDVYRKAIDSYLKDKKHYKYDQSLETILRNVANRDSVPQFYHGIKDESCQYYNGRVEISNQDFLGIVLSYDIEKKEALIEERNHFEVGDKVEFFGPNKGVKSFEIQEIKDAEGNQIDAAKHAREQVFITVPFELEKNDLMRIKRL